MKALVFQDAEAELSLMDVPIPNIQADQVLVRIHSSGICGTDLHFYKRDRLSKARKLRYPYILGHEMAGEVIELGKNVTGFSIGDRITTETHVPCGKCFYCQNDKQHICSNLESFAQKMGGVFSEFCRVPELTARKLPTGVSYREGSMFEPLGVGVRAIIEAGCQGDSLLITGCGPIGSMAIGVASALGAGPIFATENVPERREMASKMGADFVFNSDSDGIEEIILEKTKGLGVGSLIEASGSPEAFSFGVKVLRKGGKAVILGLGTKNVELDLSKWVVSKELTISGILGRRMFDTWGKMESLMEKGEIPLKIVMGEAFPLEKFREAFKSAIDGKSGKIFFEPGLKNK